MKKICCYLLFFAGMVLFGLQACSLEETAICPEDPGTGGGETPIKFTTRAPVTRTNFDGNQWETNDSIGIYMLDGGSLSITNNLNANRKYYTQPAGSANGTPGNPSDLAAANSLNLYYQASRPLKFIAYYPFMETIDNYTIPIDVTRQDNPAAIDLLYTNDGATYNDAQASVGPITLTFQHVLAKLVVNVRKEKGTDVNIDGAQGFITSVPLTAEFDLDSYTGLTAGTTLDNLGLFGNGDKSAIPPLAGYDTTFQAIIIPHTVKTGDEVLQFRTQRRLYNWPIPAGEPVEFEQGQVYTYNLTLRGETVVGFTGEITPWDTIVEAPQGGVQASSGERYKRIVRDNVDTLNVRYIRGVQFPMGTSTPGLTVAGNWAATPVHDVELTHSYHITETEITNAQYCRFLNAADNGIMETGNSSQPDTVVSGGTYDVSALTGLTSATAVKLFQTSTAPAAGGTNYTIEWNAVTKKWQPVSGMEKYPIAGVTWHGALAYAKWAGGSLPTEAQWEYAARGGVMAFDYIDGPTTGPNGSGTGTSTGTLMADYAIAGGAAGIADNPPQEVGQQKMNGYGLRDVFGNVSEWCYDRVSNGATVEYYDPSTQDRDPVGSMQANGGNAITRGFNAQTPIASLFIGNRNAQPLGATYYYLGFRVAFTFQ